MHNLQLKRVYTGISDQDGYRILVDRLWPRGLSRQKAALNEWAKEIAPDQALRLAFHHGQEDWVQFETDYVSQLNRNPDSEAFLHHIADELQKQNVTLLYGSRDESHNNAVVLKNWLEEKICSIPPASKPL